MEFKLIEGGNKKEILNKLDKLAEDHDVKTVAFAMWGKPILIVGYEPFLEIEEVHEIEE